MTQIKLTALHDLAAINGELLESSLQVLLPHSEGALISPPQQDANDLGAAPQLAAGDDILVGEGTDDDYDCSDRDVDYDADGSDIEADFSECKNSLGFITAETDNQNDQSSATLELVNLQRRSFIYNGTIDLEFELDGSTLLVQIELDITARYNDVEHTLKGEMELEYDASEDKLRVNTTQTIEAPDGTDAEFVIEDGLLIARQKAGLCLGALTQGTLTLSQGDTFASVDFSACDEAEYNLNGDNTVWGETETRNFWKDTSAWWGQALVDQLPELVNQRAGTTDSDGDGIADDREVNELGTDPDDPDTDGDCYTDGYEVIVGLDPLNPADGDCSIDSDSDGLSDSDENYLGTDPNDYDTDGDGYGDGDEYLYYGSDPLDANDPDSGDSDGDGLTDAEESLVGTDPNDSDSDDDGYSDLYEVYYYYSDPLDPNDPYDQSTSDADYDGLTYTEELAYGTDPQDSDSDNDGFNDGDEVYYTLTDPLDNQSPLMAGGEALLYGLWVTPASTYYNVSNPVSNGYHFAAGSPAVRRYYSGIYSNVSRQYYPDGMCMGGSTSLYEYTAGPDLYQYRSSGSTGSYTKRRYRIANDRFESTSLSDADFLYPNMYNRAQTPLTVLPACTINYLTQASITPTPLTSTTTYTLSVSPYLPNANSAADVSSVEWFLSDLTATIPDLVTQSTTVVETFAQPLTGTIRVRLTSRGGFVSEKTVCLTDSPYEPNDSADFAYFVTDLTDTVNMTDTQDYFAIFAQAGDTLHARVTKLVASNDELDVYLRSPALTTIQYAYLYGSYLAFSADYTAPTTGSYYLRLYRYAGSNCSTPYQVHFYKD